MKDRIKKLRKALGLNQTQFGERIGVKQNTVAVYELGRAIPSESVITLIQREFGVSEEWLRTGEGEMFVPRSREEEIAAFVHDVCGPEGTAFQRRLISLLARLTVDEWAILERIADKLTNEKEP